MRRRTIGEREASAKGEMIDDDVSGENRGILDTFASVGVSVDSLALGW